MLSSRNFPWTWLHWPITTANMIIGCKDLFISPNHIGKHNKKNQLILKTSLPNEPFFSQKSDWVGSNLIFIGTFWRKKGGPLFSCTKKSKIDWLSMKMRWWWRSFLFFAFVTSTMSSLRWAKTLLFSCPKRLLADVD